MAGKRYEIAARKARRLESVTNKSSHTSAHMLLCPHLLSQALPVAGQCPRMRVALRSIHTTKARRTDLFSRGQRRRRRGCRQPERSLRIFLAFSALVDRLTAAVVKRAYSCLPFVTLHSERTPVQLYEMVAPPGRASRDPLSSERQGPSDRPPSNPPSVILPSTLSLPTAWLAYLRFGLLSPLRYKKLDCHGSGETR